MGTMRRECSLLWKEPTAASFVYEMVKSCETQRPFTCQSLAILNTKASQLDRCEQRLQFLELSQSITNYFGTSDNEDERRKKRIYNADAFSLSRARFAAPVNQ